MDRLEFAQEHANCANLVVEQWRAEAPDTRSPLLATNAFALKPKYNPNEWQWEHSGVRVAVSAMSHDEQGQALCLCSYTRSVMLEQARALMKCLGAA